MGYGGIPSTRLPAEFGDGSFGDLHLQADANFTQLEYNLRSLTIDEGVTWSAQKWSECNRPMTIIRCQTPIILNGAICADAVSGSWIGSGFQDSGDPMGYASGFVSHAQQLSSGSPLYNTRGGSCTNGEGNYASLGANALPIAFQEGADSRASWVAGSPGWLVGPDRPYRFCVGGGGQSWHASVDGWGGIGGGILLIFAPAIQFGANAEISANGGDGIWSDVDGGGASGGGGGGHLEVTTRLPIAGSYAWGEFESIATGDRARCTANGGRPGDDSSMSPASPATAGMNGLVLFRNI